MDRKLFGPVEIGLSVAIVVSLLAGVAYGALSGIAPIPGVPQPLANRTASPLPAFIPLQPIVSPSPLLVPSPSPSSSLSPSPSPSPNPSVSPKGEPSASTPSASPVADENSPAGRDKQRKEHLAALQVAIDQYYKEAKKYPVSASFAESKTFLASSPLVILIPKYLQALPVDPQNPLRWYGYQSDGKTYTLTASLEVTTDPEGKYEGEAYLYTVKNP